MRTDDDAGIVVRDSCTAWTHLGLRAAEVRWRRKRLVGDQEITPSAAEPPQFVAGVLDVSLCPTAPLALLDSEDPPSCVLAGADAGASSLVLLARAPAMALLSAAALAATAAVGDQTPELPRRPSFVLSTLLKRLTATHRHRRPPPSDVLCRLRLPAVRRRKGRNWNTTVDSGTDRLKI